MLDFSDYSPAVLIQKAVEALTPDVASLNEQEKRRYLDKEIPNWKLNRDAGHAAPIPDPPLAYVLSVDAPGFTVAVVRGAVAVCDKYVDAAPVIALVAAVGPPISAFPGRFERGYVAGKPDNTPAGYEVAPFGASGPKFRKVIEGELGHFNYVQYYQLVM